MIVAPLSTKVKDSLHFLHKDYAECLKTDHYLFSFI